MMHVQEEVFALQEHAGCCKNTQAAARNKNVIAVYLQEHSKCNKLNV